jgi:hypothetical protein
MFVHEILSSFLSKMFKNIQNLALKTRKRKIGRSTVLLTGLNYFIFVQANIFVGLQLET